MLVSAWVFALGWLVLREYRPAPGEESSATTTVRLPPTTTFYALEAGDAQVGFRSVSTDTLANGIRVTSRFDADVPLPVVPRRVLTTTEALYDRGLGLVGFTTSVSGEGGQQSLAATMQGDSVLTVVITGRGQPRPDTVEVRLPAGVLLPDAVPIRLASRAGLKTGTTTSVAVLDPVELTVGVWDIRIGAESTIVVADSAVMDSASGRWAPAGLDTLRALRADWVEYGMPVRAWIDIGGAVIEKETPLGLAERRGPYEVVNSGYPRRRPRNVQAAPLEVSTAEPAAAAPGRMTLGAVDLRLAAPRLVTPWQDVVQGGLASRAGSPAVNRASTPRPDSVAARLPTGPLPARIVVDTRRIAGSDTAGPADQVRRLAVWVAASIQAGQPNLGGPLQTLLKRRGDSSDRSELFVAMAQSLGIPARQVVGLLSTGGPLRYRAWAEVWLGAWMPVDPTLGQAPADPGHFRLLVDATARPTTVIPMLGAVRPAITTTATAP
ncbi:MAG TPA: transglutaminase-like domain-containing protein [Gemmatimonadales bacterium]|nr:transglutaminase-like domain-containing protein [Gemmatimonadales bacterium]HRZ09619.1 transglutaminase-like domain-containing protein [Gemmatimonadales bacterium]